MANRPGPVCFRPDADLREWLETETERTGQAASTILASALRAYRRLVDPVPVPPRGSG